MHLMHVVKCPVIEWLLDLHVLNIQMLWTPLFHCLLWLFWDMIPWFQMYESFWRLLNKNNLILQSKASSYSFYTVYPPQTHQDGCPYWTWYLFLLPFGLYHCLLILLHGCICSAFLVEFSHQLTISFPSHIYLRSHLFVISNIIHTQHKTIRHWCARYLLCIYHCKVHNIFWLTRLPYWYHELCVWCTLAHTLDPLSQIVHSLWAAHT